MITVGQKLHYVPATRSRRAEPTEVTVTAVGRKWVTVQVDGITGRTMRFESTDKHMELDGGQLSSPGRCYLSREDYEAERALHTRWHELAKWVGQHKWGPPHGMTVERIAQAEALLKVYEEVIE